MTSSGQAVHNKRERREWERKRKRKRGKKGEGKRGSKEGGGRDPFSITKIKGKPHPLPVTNLLVCLVGGGVILVALSEDLEKVRVRTEVQGSLVFVVMNIEVSPVGGEEDGNRGTALFLL